MLIGIISPYSGPVQENEAYLRRCMALVLAEGHTPVAGHAYLPHVLDDNDAAQRERGIKAGHDLLSACTEVHVFCDRGISAGMWQDIDHALSTAKPVVMRTIGGSMGYVTGDQMDRLKWVAFAGIDVRQPPWTRKETAND